MSAIQKLLRASSFAAVRHAEQKRKGTGLPYIIHPIGVADILANEAGVDDVTVLQAALLHDVVEDTGTSIEEVHELFGIDVATIVAEVTDDKTLGKAERKRQQIAHAASASHGAKLVKLADKLYNLRDLQTSPPMNWELLRVQGYFVWSWFVVEGLRGTNAVLEAELDGVFASTVTFHGHQKPAIPANPSKKVQLQAYMDEMDKAGD